MFFTRLAQLEGASLEGTRAALLETCRGMMSTGDVPELWVCVKVKGTDGHCFVRFLEWNTSKAEPYVRLVATNIKGMWAENMVPRSAVELRNPSASDLEELGS